MLSKEEISKVVCPRCGRMIGEKPWTLNPMGQYVCAINCNNLHPNYRSY